MFEVKESLRKLKNKQFKIIFEKEFEGKYYTIESDKFLIVETEKDAYTLLYFDKNDNLINYHKLVEEFLNSINNPERDVFIALLNPTYLLNTIQFESLKLSKGNEIVLYYLEGYFRIKIKCEGKYSKPYLL